MAASLFLSIRLFLMQYTSWLRTRKFLIILALSCFLYSRYTPPHYFPYKEPFHQLNSQDEQFTIRLNSYRRNDLLKKSVEHYAKCPDVYEIQIIWSDQQNEPPPTSFFHLEELYLSKVKYEVHQTNSLNNRFFRILPVSTEGVFSVDDDIIISCDTLNFAFLTWRSSRQTLVGFSPRIHSYNSKTGKYGYVGSYLHVWWRGIYSIILTKDCFLHRDYLDIYTNKMPKDALNFIDDHKNCEDIAMAFLVANETHQAPIWVKGKVHDYGHYSGISGSSSHLAVRSECVDTFTKHFKRFPLVISRSKVISASYRTN